jgi:hypothetical protein
MPLKLQSSSGGSVTLDVPVTASNYTVTVPNATGTAMVSGNMPTFCAYSSNSQSIGNVTWTKIQFNTEEWDTASCFDSTTNYRFTPNVAGYYQFNVQVEYTTIASARNMLAFYKNGSEYKRGSDMQASYSIALTGAHLIYCNGSTDYVEVYIYQASGGSLTLSNGSNNNTFTGVLVRAA